MDKNSFIDKIKDLSIKEINEYIEKNTNKSKKLISPIERVKI